ncbi:MAG: hypothetical protein WC356_02105 [Candidatus Micrarchaeia archaeon]|jgi:hypothetical protein
MIATLCEIKGMIANVAIENPEHNQAISRLDLIIDKYGLMARVDSDMIIKILYG